MRQITQITRKLKQGMTTPILCKTEDGVEYCCKGVHAGIRSLCNEWICANLAKALNLPIPEFEILDVPLKLFETWDKANRNERLVFVNSRCHFVFASKMVSHVKDVVNPLELADKKVDNLGMCRVVMFDRIIRNCDRADYNSNLLMTAGKQPSIFIIDHNLAFDEDFNRGDFLRNHILRNFYCKMKQEDKDCFFGDVRRLLSDGIIGDIKSKIPVAWLNGLTEQDAEFLENLEEIIEREVE